MKRIAVTPLSGFGELTGAGGLLLRQVGVDRGEFLRLIASFPEGPGGWWLMRRTAGGEAAGRPEWGGTVPEDVKKPFNHGSRPDAQRHSNQTPPSSHGPRI